jgi:hypothetical protein
LGCRALIGDAIASLRGVWQDHRDLAQRRVGYLIKDLNATVKALIRMHNDKKAKLPELPSKSAAKDEQSESASAATYEGSIAGEISAVLVKGQPLTDNDENVPPAAGISLSQTAEEVDLQQSQLEDEETAERSPEEQLDTVLNYITCIAGIAKGNEAAGNAVIGG